MQQLIPIWQFLHLFIQRNQNYYFIDKFYKKMKEKAWRENKYNCNNIVLALLPTNYIIYQNIYSF